MSYDNVGNLINDTWTNPNAGGAMEYDADNHMTSVVNGSHKYRYNADGKRVKRIIAAQGEFWMVYGIGGELVAEYNASTGIPAQTSPGKEYGYRGGQMVVIAEGATVKWLVQDHLGSTRMEIGLAGNLSDVTRHDYLPFGEELAGAMRSGNGYGGTTNTKQKFTGYERDSETGLDFAQARYMSSVQGRFTGVDPNGVGAAIEEPQSWNGYAYVGNRPTTLTDPSGLLWLQHRNSAGDVDGYSWVSTQKEYDDAVSKGWKIATFDQSKPFEYSASCLHIQCTGVTHAPYTLEPNGTHHLSNEEAGHGMGINFDVMFAVAGPINGIRVGATELIELAWARVGQQAAKTAAKEVIFDTNAVYQFGKASALLEAGETPVITNQVLTELNTLAAQGALNVPRAANGLSIVEDVVDVSTQAMLRRTLGNFAGNPANLNSVQGLAGDGIIGTTGILTGRTIITADKILYSAVLKNGGSSRLLVP